jgi:hypothetical protein
MRLSLLMAMTALHFFAAEARACVYEYQSYAEGAHVCQGGQFMRCQGNDWAFTGASCNGPALEIVAARYSCGQRWDDNHCRTFDTTAYVRRWCSGGSISGPRLACNIPSDNRLCGGQDPCRMSRKRPIVKYRCVSVTEEVSEEKIAIGSSTAALLCP